MDPTDRRLRGDEILKVDKLERGGDPRPRDRVSKSPAPLSGPQDAHISRFVDRLDGDLSDEMLKGIKRDVEMFRLDSNFVHGRDPLIWPPEAEHAYSS